MPNATRRDGKEVEQVKSEADEEEEEEEEERQRQRRGTVHRRRAVAERHMRDTREISRDGYAEKVSESNASWHATSAAGPVGGSRVNHLPHRHACFGVIGQAGIGGRGCRRGRPAQGKPRQVV